MLVSSLEAWVQALEARHLADLTFSEVSRALRALSSAYVERRARLSSGAALSGAGKRAAFALFYGPLHYLLVKHVARNSKDNPEASCLPMGLMQFWTQGFPRKFVHTPKLLVVLYEASAGLRQIYIDGRPLPKQGDPQPYYYGYSSGHWEGDTLVVESNNFRDDGWLDIVGTPTTDQLKMTERFTRTSFGRMNIDITIDDPKAFTKPWTVRHVQELMPDADIIEFICVENNHFAPR
jgi:hypothetical protein